MAKEKVVLAYSGGLDTTAIIPWLKEHFNYDVICCCIDCGQGNELDDLEERAKLSGAEKLYMMNSVMIILFHVYRQVQYMKTSIFSVHQWQGRESQRRL